MNKLEILKVLTNVNKFTKPQQPANNVSLFIADSFDTLFGDPKDDFRIIKNILILQTNADPQVAAEKLLKFAMLFETWLAENH